MNAPAHTGTAIGPQEALDLFHTAMPAVAAPGGVRIAAHIAGSVNRIFRVETLAGSFALRVRHNEANFLYEKGLFKEVIAARLIQAFERDTPAECSAALAQIWHSIVQSRSAGPVEFPPGANILYYDFTGSIHPAPWAVFQWCGDALGAGFDAAHARALGRAVARMHRLKFDCAYASLDRAGLRDILLEWTHEILRRNSATGSIVAGGADLQHKLEALCRASEPVREFVFCHNDLHCLNVTAPNGGLHIVDWDNAQIAPKRTRLREIGALVEARSQRQVPAGRRHLLRILRGLRGRRRQNPLLPRFQARRNPVALQGVRVHPQNAGRSGRETALLAGFAIPRPPLAKIGAGLESPLRPGGKMC